VFSHNRYRSSVLIVECLRRAKLAMKNKQRNSDKLKFQIEFDDGGVLARRRTQFLPDGSYLFQDDLKVKGSLTAKVITCAAWLLELYELQAGELLFISGETHIRPGTKCFGVFYPPFTISQASFKDAKGRLVGVAAATESLPTGFTEVPTMFETMCPELPTGVAQVLEIVRLGQNHQSVELNPKPSLLSVKAKRLIDENYLSYPSISRIAQRLGVTHEHLSRQFKRDFQSSPSAYLHQLRLADAPLKLAKGEEIINVSQDVGYNDLSRFYKQFRKTTKTSPGVCQTLMRPNRV
jgi:AraC-like DNA-binding protein